VEGLEHYEQLDQKALIIVNHVSFLDPVFLTLFLPGEKSFAVHGMYARAWYLKIFDSMAKQFSIDHADSMAMKSLIEYLNAGHRVIVFPEGRITTTGSLMKIYSGAGMIADKSNAQIVPIHISGLEYSTYSRLKGIFHLCKFPRVRITIFPPAKLELSPALKSRMRRQKAAEHIASMMTRMVFEAFPYQQRIWDALLDARDIHGDQHAIVEDMDRQPLTYKTLCLKSFVLSYLFKVHCEAGKRIGVLLPNTNATIVTFLALQSMRCVPAMLNFTMGLKATGFAIEAANIGTVITSRKFIELAELEALASYLEERVNVLYLEDLRAELTLTKKLKGLYAAHRSRAVIRSRLRQVKADDEAVVLFTSGSEGIPKGVVLSHQNLLANVSQGRSRMRFTPQEVCLNALPLFHSFGLTGGTLLPLMQGTPIFLYPSPLHYKVIPEVAYDINATIIFGTNVFLNGYAKHADVYDFYSLRYVIAGAEKVQDETRQLWFAKFGLRILEGYGATETAPILTINTPREFRLGSVGKFCPAIEYKLEHVPGINTGGKLWVKGPNIMAGYVMHDRPGELQPPSDGWYDTGDIVDIDEDGYVFIQGRAKRFAKIAGEMISLAAVEELVSNCWPEYRHAALAMPDHGKGEKIILITTLEHAERRHLVQFAHENGIPDIQVPKKLLYVDDVPLLGSGKIHYPAAQALAEKILGESSGMEDHAKEH